MAEVKWIKMATNIWDNRKIVQIESLPDGDTIIVIWLKLLCLAGTTNDSGMFILQKKYHIQNKCSPHCLIDLWQLYSLL